MNIDEMTFDDFGNLFKVGDDLGIFGRFRKGNADIGAYVQTDGLRLDEQPASGDDAGVLQALDPLVDGSARNTAFPGDFKVRHPGVFHQEGEDLLIDLVDVVTGHCLQILTNRMQK